MKYSLTLFIFTLTFFLLVIFQTLAAQDHDHVHTEADSSEVVALSEPVFSTDQFDVYGSEIGEIESISPLNKASNIDFSVRDAADLHFEGILTEICQTRGCNFYLDDGEEQIRVRFFDYSFFIPTDSGGKKSVVRGDFVQKEDEETGEPFVEILSTAIKIYK